MRDLYVTLGHNASAVLAEDGFVQRGYEQERLDRRKSSSAFPALAIERALGNLAHCDRVFVSHWFDHFGLNDNKYLDTAFLKRCADHVITLSPEFTHHDAHCQSAIDFVECRRPRMRAYVLVIDGFGNNQECLSIYSHEPNRLPSLLHRSYGYDVSLGLMYQYVTKFLGMKPNQDEYKLLGYEAHVLEYAPRERVVANYNIVSQQGRDHAHRMLSARDRRAPVPGALIDYNRLVMAECMWTECADIWRRLWDGPLDERGVRSVVAFCAQTFLEGCVLEILEQYALEDNRDLILAGGVFLNVKLSRRVRQSWTTGNVFVHPLCGDQGAAMGHTPKLQSSGLCWGDRDLDTDVPLPVGCEFTTSGEWINRAQKHLDKGGVVNVVREGAEFGPRALCNTTTFARPTSEMVSLINWFNDRDDAMPMAPVMTKDAALYMLDNDELRRSEVSNQYMVTTVAFKQKPPDHLLGVAHPHPFDGSWTARPQVVSGDSELYWLLRGVEDETLINTSYNFHGEPIVQSVGDAIRTHQMQTSRAHELGIKKPLTLLVLP